MPPKSIVYLICLIPTITIDILRSPMGAWQFYRDDKTGYKILFNAL